MHADSMGRLFTNEKNLCPRPSSVKHLALSVVQNSSRFPLFFIFLTVLIFDLPGVRLAMYIFMVTATYSRGRERGIDLKPVTKVCRLKICVLIERWMIE